MKKAALVGVMFLCACGNKDMLGEPLSDTEEAALLTCNDWLSTDFKGMLGGIIASEASFRQDDTKEIYISWMAETKVGKGPVVCWTDGSGMVVKGALVDGIPVKP